MGRMLGAFADDSELDRPDLNKCPDCNCFFAGNNCPICGKECPEEMRAGNRAPVKPKKQKRASYDGSRTTFIEWYHSWWFIALMALFLPVVAIILLITSPYKRWKKILFVVLAVVYMLLSTYGISAIISDITDIWDKPVDASISREEYVERCESVSAEQIYRFADGYEDKFVCVKLKIIGRVTYVDDYYNAKNYVCYLCEAENGSSFNIVLRDCLVSGEQKLIEGDVVTVYGEGAGECNVFDEEYNDIYAPCINMAYVEIE